jgi:hypothetical protein
MIARVWMWECDYGFAKHYTNLMGASPLHEYEYVAAYEEAEAIGIAVEYLKTIEDAAPRGACMLLAEYVLFCLHRGKYYFPENFSREGRCRFFKRRQDRSPFGDTA